MPPVIDFQALFEALPNPYMLLDGVAVRSANAAYLRVTASRLEELLARACSTCSPTIPTIQSNDSAGAAAAVV